MKKLVDLLLEREIGQVTQNITVRMQIDKTAHAGERQMRAPGEEISEQEILETCHTALPKISKMLILGTVSIGNSILIHDTHSDLNIVGALESKESMIELVVITVMRKKNFVPKIGTLVIEI